MKIYHNIYISIIVLFFSLTVFLCTLYNFGLSKVSNDDTLKKVVIEPGSIDSIAVTLYNNNMIRSKLAFNIYVRLNNKTNLMAATYELSENMGTKKIVDIMNKGENSTSEVSITFKEGLNMRRIAKLIEENTNNTEEDVYSLLKDVNNIEEAKNIINDNFKYLGVIIEEETSDYELSFGYNYFPRKVYKGVIYQEGMYESLVVTLGRGEGDNWWCVLFPPLCLLEENENTDDVEYKFLVKELIEKYF